MNGRQKSAFLIWGSVVGVLAAGGAAAVYLGTRSGSAVEQAATDSPFAAAEGVPTGSAGPAGAVGSSAAFSGGSGTAPLETAADADVIAGPDAAEDPAADAGGESGAAGGFAVAPEAAAQSMPAPSLDDSDPEIRGELNELVGQRTVTQFIVPERIIRNVVVTIDNLTLKKASIEQRPVKPMPGKFVTGGSESAPVIAAENYARYDTFIDAMQRVDTRRLVAVYRDLQPLFQEAYEELGHPNESFTGRLLEIIDHLLEAPDVEGTIPLVQPGLFYEYADKELESLSVGKKLLIRLGPKNRAAVKKKLREIRAELV